MSYICYLSVVNVTRFSNENSSGEFHEDDVCGLVTVCRQLIFAKYPGFDSHGFNEFNKSTPVVYIGEASRISIGHQLCVQVKYTIFYKYVFIYDPYSAPNKPCTVVPGDQV